MRKRVATLIARVCHSNKPPFTVALTGGILAGRGLPPEYYNQRNNQAYRDKRPTSLIARQATAIAATICHVTIKLIGTSLSLKSPYTTGKSVF